MHKNKVIIRLFLGLPLWDTFIMWKLHFSRFLKKAFLIILEIRYLHVQLLCMLGPNFWITFLWYVCISHWNDRVIYLPNVITFFDDVRITLYFDMFGLRMEITLKLRFVFALHCDILSLRYSYVIYLFNIVTFSNNLRITLYFGTFELLMEITLQFVFARHCNIILLRHNDVVLFRRNYAIYLFDVVTFFDNVRITLYFRTLELGMEIKLQLRFVFARHCDVYFITSQLRYLFVRCGYNFWWR